MIKNTLSVDLESFIHRSLDINDREIEDNGYTPKATEYLLNLFEKYDTKVTFFVLGEIYDLYPSLIEDIKKAGHEIGYHGHRHIILENEKILFDDLNNSKNFLKKYNPIGFRAPRMFLKQEYLKILKDYGFKYDSSSYGGKIQNIGDSKIKEIPVSVFNYFNNDRLINFPQNMKREVLLAGLPFGSGLFMSVLQKKIQFFIDASSKNKKGVNLFIHPWQLFDYKNSSITFLQKFLYQRKINNTLEYLLSKNKFYPLKDLL